MVNIVSTLKKMANKLINLNNTKLDIATMQSLYGTKTTLTTGHSMASNWTLNDYTASLLGNKILIYINATRSSNFEAGNIDNEVIGTFTCKTLGSISNVYSTALIADVYGNMTTGYTSSVAISGTGTNQTLSFGITVSANHSGYAQLSFRFAMPVRPNLSYYNLS